MKITIAILIIAMTSPVKDFAQTQLNKTIPVQPGQKINMHFDYPELVQVSTWDRNEISVQGTVSINGGENDDAFIFENAVNGNVIDLRSFIKDLKNLPQRITIMRDGQKIMFRTKADLKKYQEEHGGGYNTMSWGADIDIKLEIKVPKNIETRVESVYGMVEIKNFNGPLTVEATYGGVDAALAERAAGEVIAETNYGEIYTNFDTKFSGGGFKERDFHTYVTAKPGSGPKYTFESKYGNVYIRKAGQ
ncbi:hypothetical protein KK083_04625 [Fulvivirgaceae bacterium PWU4]|uniref:Adhesin domain-containing protein n=1 Tax=Chryseosolibacter histidini TaxID=2782349 RepID=A0AAP2DH53_9BACT|nr:DUF4097 domain-containing protein [Chryseosolibacter histidini]MBT1696146.1 hypothetical protein [Chryseosolibacter histidini]